MSEDKILNVISKKIRSINNTTNKIVPFMSLFIFLMAVITQIMREVSYSFRTPQQMCLLPLILIPNISFCIGAVKKKHINKYLIFATIFNALSWVLVVVSEDFIMPTYLYGLEHAEVILAACFLGSVINVVSVITKWKPFIIATIVFNIVVYIGIIIYVATTMPILDRFQTESVYYSTGYIFFYLSILFNIENITTKNEIDILNEDWDDFPELYNTDEELIDPIKTFYEVYMLRNVYHPQLDSGVEYNIWYNAVTEGKYLDYMKEHHLYGEEFIDKMISDLLMFHDMCEEGLDDVNEKLSDFFKALQIIKNCENKEEKDRHIYNLMLMCRADRRFFYDNK